MSAGADTQQLEPINRWSRLKRSLLYGRNADRAAKARARIGLAIFAFVGVYAIIAVRLVMFGIASEGGSARAHSRRRCRGDSRAGNCRSQRQVLATDIRVPSLYGEPRRLIDREEVLEMLRADLRDVDSKELRERIFSKRGFVWLKRDVTPEQQRIYHQGMPGIGFLKENKRVYPNGSLVSHLIGHVNIDNQGIAGIEKWLDTHGLAALHMAGLATDRLQNRVECGDDTRVQQALRDELVAARVKFAGAGGGRRCAQCPHRRNRRHGVGA